MQFKLSTVLVKTKLPFVYFGALVLNLPTLLPRQHFHKFISGIFHRGVNTVAATQNRRAPRNIFILKNESSATLSVAG